MSDSPDDEAGGRTGRPRDPDLDDRILGTALGLLVERGLGNLKIEDVARTAHVGLSTIYRRWPTKEDLVVAVLEFVPTQSGPETGPAVIDKLVTGLESQAAGLMPSVLTAMLADPALDELIRERFIEPDRAALRAYARELGADNPSLSEDDLAWIADTALAAIVYRGVILREPLTDTRDRVMDMMQVLTRRR